MANDFDESSANEEASKGLSWWYSADVLSRDKSDKTAKRIRRISITDRLLRHPGRLSMVYFGALIIIVTGLLLLPISTSDIIFTNFPIAFFTAVSALSTCGIPVVNTGEYWSMFGQVVVLFSIQFGGLGVMTFASMVALGVSRRLKVSQRMLTANELGTTKLSEVKGVLTVVLGTSIIAEVLTFVLLLPDLFRVNHGNMGRTLWQALFYAVSAYNNTGFTPDATGLHVNRWGVGLPILISAFIGTLGFPVVLNLVQCARRRLSPKRWTLHTKLTLVTTAVLVATSLAWFLLVEWSNTGLFPADDPGMKMRRAMSAAVMPRSAGFDISWVPEVTNETKVFMSILMFIGAGSSSTAGGIRVTTFAVILLICRAAFTGHRDVTVFRRRIPRRIQMTAVSVTTACFALVMVGAMMLMFTTGCAFVDAVFEALLGLLVGWLFGGRGKRRQSGQPVYSVRRDDCRTTWPVDHRLLHQPTDGSRTYSLSAGKHYRWLIGHSIGAQQSDIERTIIMAAKPSGNKSVLVIGLGRFGGSVAATLDQMGQDVLAVDKNPELVARWSAHLPTIQADMTDVLAIEQIDASQFDTAVVAIGDSIEASVIITGNLLDAGVSDLWAKSVSQEHARILQRIGARHIINAETDAGKRVGHLVAGNYLDYIEIDGPYTVVKVHTPLYAVGRSIEDVQVHDKYGVTVVGLKAPGKEFQYGSKELVMHRNDELILMGKQDQIDHFIQG